MAEPVRILHAHSTFALGGKTMYETINRNPDMWCCPVDYTNMPHVIMRNDNVVSINSTTQVDLQGQAASESDGHRHISGTGGQLQFVRGAYASKGGRSFICLPSTYEKDGLRNIRFATNGFGAGDPVAPNTKPDGSDNPDGRRKNRRVEILIAK